MTIVEIQQLIDEKNSSSIQLSKQLSLLNRELYDLRDKLYQLEMIEFVNYLQIGEVIQLDNYYSFSGYCKDPKATNSFSIGEKFKIVKKNKKSIVIEVVKKFKKQWDQSQRKSVIIGETNPGWLIRVDLDSFFHFYMKNNKSAFESYIKRKQALDSLFDE